MERSAASLDASRIEDGGQRLLRERASLAAEREQARSVSAYLASADGKQRLSEVLSFQKEYETTGGVCDFVVQC
jgi:hypothetical protein